MNPILVATDLSTRGDRAIARAGRLAAAMQVPLVLTHVIDADLPDEIATPWRNTARVRLDRLRRALIIDPAVRAEIRVVTGDVCVDIHRLAEDIGAGLLVLGLHRQRPFLDSFRETTLERLVRLERRPVLVVCDPADADYSRVLAAIDFSPGCARAAAAGRILAPIATMRGFHAVHVAFQGLSDAAGSHVEIAQYLAEARLALQAWGNHEGQSRLAAATEVADGALSKVLSEQLAAHRPDLLTLGAHGETGRPPIWLGSFANDMMRDPPCDLLIARP